MARKRKDSTKQLTIHQILAEENETRRGIEAACQLILAVKEHQRRHDWHVKALTPPGSFISTSTNVFTYRTDIPPQITLHTAMSIAAAYLLQRNVSLSIPGNPPLRPSIWTIVLAGSGDCKTFTKGRILDFVSTSESIKFPADFATAAKFVEILQSHNNKLWCKDEFGEFLKNIKNQSYMAEFKDYLLKLYDHQPIERQRAKNPIVVDNPALVILGLTVLGTFADCLDVNDLMDGFAQRFNYVVANVKRTAEDIVPLYEFYDRDIFSIRDSWEEFVNQEFCTQYVLSDKAKQGYELLFKSMWPRFVLNTGMHSYFRRVCFSGLRYALIYHSLLKKADNPNVDLEDIEWGARMVVSHLYDLKEVLEEKYAGPSEMAKLLESSERVIRDIKSQGGIPQARDLVARIRGIRTANEARIIMQLLNGAAA